MSRAYRIRVSETLREVVRAEDHVRSQLEMLDILPSDQMADLLSAELVKRGFERVGDTAVRVDDGTKVVVDLKESTVTVSRETSKEVKVSEQRTGTAWDDMGPSEKETKERLQKELVSDLKEDVQERQRELQQEVTDQLESQLSDLRLELDQAVNRATAEALKQKAAQIGQIKEVTEDPESGSMTIVVEV
ncbi:MAG: hypothetical protein ACR2NZ_15610 [Rubripirellula sp.]